MTNIFNKKNKNISASKNYTGYVHNHTPKIDEIISCFGCFPECSGRGAGSYWCPWFEAAIARERDGSLSNDCTV